MRILASDLRDDKSYKQRKAVLIEKKVIARNAQDLTDTSLAILRSQK